MKTESGIVLREAKIDAVVDYVGKYTRKDIIDFRFKMIQGSLWISRRGKIAKILKLKENDKVEIIIRKVKP